MRTARDWFQKNYRAQSLEEAMQIIPMGSQENAYFRMVVSYWEMAASFITAGVLNKELFYESNGELLFVWIRVQPILAGFRAMTKNPESWKNLETVGNSFIEHIKAKGPGVYEGMVAMVNMQPPAAAKRAG
jgi:L-rhamnose mutarotase